MHKKQTTWVLIMDGARGQVFELALSPLRLAPRPDGCFIGTRLKTKDLTSDRPGHGQESVGSARHGLEPRTDAHRHHEEVFAADIAKHIAQESDAGAFDHLIVVAPPRALGDLRAQFPKQLREKKVRFEIPGDWTKLSPTAAAEHLHPHLVEAGMIAEAAG